MMMTMTTELNDSGLEFKRGWETRQRLDPLPPRASEAFKEGWMAANKAKLTPAIYFPRIIARRYDGSYLVLFEGDVGQIFDPTERVKHRPSNVNSILARGYWELIDKNAPQARPSNENPLLRSMLSYKLIA